MEMTLEKLSFEMVTHISFDDCHSKIEHHVVKDENSRLNGKIIARETHTSKSRKTGKFGKSKSYYYIKEEGSKIYNTLKEFVENEYYEPRKKSEMTKEELMESEKAKWMSVKDQLNLKQ